MRSNFATQLIASPFIKNVSTLAAGTVISQVILIIASPVLTRLFSATNFGILAVFTSISSIAAILTTGRYELAIGLPEKDEDAADIVGLVTFIGLIISLIYLFLIIILKIISHNFYLSNELINSPIVFLIPFYTFFAATLSGFQYWSQRQKYYKLISFSNTTQAIGATVLNVIFGLLSIRSFGLVYGLLIGQMLSIIVLFFPLIKSGYLFKINIRNFKVYARRYISFPKYMIVSDLSTTTSQQIIPIIFSLLFSTSIVGFFSLANRMLRIPSIVLTSSIANVFRNDAIDDIRASGNCKSLYTATIKKLIILGVPIYLFLAVASPWLFSIFFGKDWLVAGTFARVICIMMIFDFLALPLNSLFYVVKKQKMYMHIQFLNTIFGIAFIYLGFALFNSAYYSILFFALNNALFSLINLYVTYNLSKSNYELI